MCHKYTKSHHGRTGMKTIGMIGGMSWESTIPYYRIVNEEIRNKPGCTELGSLIDQADVEIPVFDTTVIHALKAAELALEE